MKLRNMLATVPLAALLPLTTAGTFAAVTTLARPAPVTCAIPKPCAMFANTSSGAAVEGASGSGTGLFGTSSSGMYDAPGVDGESSNSDGEDAGGAFGINVISTGVAPEYGVLAYGDGFGLAGEENAVGTSPSTAGYGVFGQDTTGTASSFGDYNVGVVGQSTAGTGMLAESNGTPTTGTLAALPVGVYAVAETLAGTPSDAAVAVAGESNAYGADLENTASKAVAYVVSPNFFLEGSAAGGGSFTLDYAGNMNLSGTLTTKASPNVRATGTSGTARTEYTERMTAPQVEDVGEGQLAGGRAYVAIDPSLADTIDRRVAYHVFVTPEGDCNGLYVTQKTAAGFTVRELRAGRASLAFEYRIVAKPVDETGQRLAIAPALRPLDEVAKASGRARRSLGPILSPQERLKRRMGTQAYARAMLELRMRQQTGL